MSNNIDLLDSNFAIFLRLWAMATFAQMEQGIPQAGSADIIGHFSSLIINFSLGDKVANLEIAIVGYEVATTVLTRETYPEKWAMMKYSLALLRPVVKIVKDAQEAGFISNQIFFIQEILPDQDSWPQTFEEYLKYEDFLMELLQVTSNNDFQELAVILKSGINRLDKLFAQVLRKWAILEMFERDPQKAHIVATDIGNLISKIKDFPLGKRRDNLEIAIIGYYVISVLFTKENYPLQWAMLQMNLASAYCSRVQGNPAINLELSIAFYQSALQIFFVDKYKEYWAATQQNLGNAYANRIYGSRAENLNLAISAYQSVLQVLRLEDSSQMQIWAKTQSNLGNAYNDQVRGNRLEDVELAIGAYQAALQVYKPETFPEDWARTQTNLANSYSNRVKGDRSENLEIAIDYYQLALQVYKPETFPQEWARTKICLGSAYDDRIRGTREENLEQAITTYEEALQIYNREAFPKKWATTCMNLAVSYQHRLRGDREENQERAICLYQECLQVITQAQYPEQWAEVHINLANTYHNRLKGERTENLKQAIAATEGALQILTRQEFPERWAGIQVTLGTIYQKQRQVVEAIACFRAAIEVYQPRTFPIECLQAAGRLGYIASLAELWIEVIEGYDTAIQAVEQSRTWASTDRRKQEIISEVIDVYVGIVQAYIKINQPDKAIEYVERSKARNLVELLATRDLYPKGDIPEAVINELSRLRRAIDAEQRRVEIQQTNRNSNGGTISGETRPPNRHPTNYQPRFYQSHPIAATTRRIARP
ncbi:hypothetical protein [Microcoleus vaginatus]|uniref:hypothetical protein n=1 Tax=Microcoleus vaginatus TaxID=119532 RepID=UPI00403FA153